MQAFYQWVGVINLLGSVQAFVLFLIFLNQKEKNRSASRILALICLSLGLVIAGSVLGVLGYYKIVPNLIRIGDPFLLAIPPLIFLYTKTLCRQPLRKGDVIHFIPFVLYVIILLPFYSLPGKEKIQLVDELFHSTSASPQLVIIAAVRLIMTGTYLFLSLQLVPQTENRLKKEYSDINIFGIYWWQHVLKLCLYLTGISLVLFILFYVRMISFLEMNVWTGMVASGMLYLMAYKRWKHREVPATEEAIEPAIEEDVLTAYPPETASGKYQTSGLRQDEIEKYGKTLQTYLVKDQPFLNPDLTINDLAAAINLPAYILSQVINRYFQQNFFDLVNGYRVKEVIRLMSDPDKQSFTLLALAFEAGFNSKSAFNQVFKKHTGKTPSTFRNE